MFEKTKDDVPKLCHSVRQGKVKPVLQRKFLDQENVGLLGLGDLG